MVPALDHVKPATADLEFERRPADLAVDIGKPASDNTTFARRLGAKYLVKPVLSERPRVRCKRHVSPVHRTW
jgi:hypothetical protein